MVSESRKLKPSKLVDLENLQGHLKMTYEFSGKKYISYRQLLDIIRLYLKGD